jgi:hypothetical protein
MKFRDYLKSQVKNWPDNPTISVFKVIDHYDEWERLKKSELKKKVQEIKS